MEAATEPAAIFVEIISNRWVVGLGLPVAFIVVGAMIKQMIDKEAGKEEWLLGVELGLAGVTTTLVDLADWTRHNTNPEGQRRAVLYLLCEFVMFFALMWLHSEVMKRRVPADRMSWKQFWLLFFAGNAIGGTLLSLYLLFVKGLE